MKRQRKGLHEMSDEAIKGLIEVLRQQRKERATARLSKALHTEHHLGHQTPYEKLTNERKQQ